MIEMLVAISIISASLVGILALVGRSVALNRITTEQYVATYLASEGMEIVKNFFDHSYFLATPGSAEFYGWDGPGSIAPSGLYGVYVVEYDDDYDDWFANQISGCAFAPPPTQAEVTAFFRNCPSIPYLYFSVPTGYTYDLSGTKTKFRRVIIIDRPAEGNPAGVPPLDYRVTAAVSWETRGGEFVVQLQDHFLPWRIP